MFAVPSPCRRRPIRTRPEGLDLYGYQDATAPNPTARPSATAGWRVVEDWPRQVPVISEELDVFEAWFGDVLDDLFGPGWPRCLLVHWRTLALACWREQAMIR